MKKCLAIVAAAAAVIFSEGVCFEILHWPGGAIITFVGMILAVIALIMALICMLKKPGHNIVKWISMLSVIIAFVAGAFKFLHWPGGAHLCLLAFGILLPIAAIVLAIDFARSEK